MTDESQLISYNKLVTRFTQLGPYLRKEKTNEEQYFFDCLSVCINADKTPETREFWGWWFELNATDDGFRYDYQFGKFNTAGDWLEENIPNQNSQEVQETLSDFYQKLQTFVEQDLNLKILPATELNHPKLS